MPKKSAKNSPRKNVEPTPDQALRFLDDVRALYRGADEPTRAISVRVPANVLRAFKAKAGFDGRKYQSVIVALMREWVSGTKPK